VSDTPVLTGPQAVPSGAALCGAGGILCNVCVRYRLRYCTTVRHNPDQAMRAWGCLWRSSQHTGTGAASREGQSSVVMAYRCRIYMRALHKPN